MLLLCKLVVEPSEEVATNEAIGEAPSATDECAGDRRTKALINGGKEGEHRVTVGATREEADECEEDEADCPCDTGGESEGFGVEWMHGSCGVGESSVT